MVVRSGRFHLVLAVVSAGVVVVAIGSLFLLTGPEHADRLSSGIGAGAGVIGLIVSGFGALRARRERGGEQAPEAGAVPQRPVEVTMRAEVSDNGRVYQVGHGSMEIHES